MRWCHSFQCIWMAFYITLHFIVMSLSCHVLCLQVHCSVNKVYNICLYVLFKKKKVTTSSAISSTTLSDNHLYENDINLTSMSCLTWWLPHTISNLYIVPLDNGYTITLLFIRDKCIPWCVRVAFYPQNCVKHFQLFMRLPLCATCLHHNNSSHSCTFCWC